MTTTTSFQPGDRIRSLPTGRTGTINSITIDRAGILLHYIADDGTETSIDATHATLLESAHTPDWSEVASLAGIGTQYTVDVDLYAHPDPRQFRVRCSSGGSRFTVADRCTWLEAIRIAGEHTADEFRANDLNPGDGRIPAGQDGAAAYPTHEALAELDAGELRHHLVAYARRHGSDTYLEAQIGRLARLTGIELADVGGDIRESAGVDDGQPEPAGTRPPTEAGNDKMFA